MIEALKVALPAAGFALTSRLSAQLRLRDGTQTGTTTSWTVWGWRDRRHGAVFVAQSGVPYSGGGAFAAVAIDKGEWICRYTGCPVPASVVRIGPTCQAGYVKRVGGPYVDARDPNGRLRLGDGTLVDTHAFSHADWEGGAQHAWRGVGGRGGALALHPAGAAGRARAPKPTVPVLGGTTLLHSYAVAYLLLCTLLHHTVPVTSSQY